MDFNDKKYQELDYFGDSFPKALDKVRAFFRGGSEIGNCPRVELSYREPCSDNDLRINAIVLGRSGTEDRRFNEEGDDVRAYLFFVPEDNVGEARYCRAIGIERVEGFKKRNGKRSA